MRSPTVGVLVLLLGLLLPACARPEEQSPAGPVDQSSAGVSETPAPPANYQELLTRTDRELAEAFAAIREAPTLDALGQAVLTSAGVASSAGERLGTSVLVPPPAAADNAALADGLRELGRELAYLSQQINAGAICAGPAALAAISTAPSMPGLRDASARLGTAQGERPAYRWGAALPPPTEVIEPKLSNGAVLVDHRVPSQSGEGVLEVRNEGSADAVVILAERESTLLSLAVNAGQSARVEGIPDGDYQLYYTAGRGWDPNLGVFVRYCEFHQFTEPTSFQTRPTPGGSAYTVETVTIRDPAEGGPGGESENTRQIPPSNLPR